MIFNLINSTSITESTNKALSAILIYLAYRLWVPRRVFSGVLGHWRRRLHDQLQGEKSCFISILSRNSFPLRTLVRGGEWYLFPLRKRWEGMVLLCHGRRHGRRGLLFVNVLIFRNTVSFAGAGESCPEPLPSKRQTYQSDRRSKEKIANISISTVGHSDLCQKGSAEP